MIEVDQFDKESERTENLAAFDENMPPNLLTKLGGVLICKRSSDFLFPYFPSVE